MNNDYRYNYQHPQQPGPYNNQPQQRPYPHQAHTYQQQPPAQPAVVVNNNFGGGMRQRRKPQSVLIHIILALFTMGIGNIFYALYVHNWNAARGL